MNMSKSWIYVLAAMGMCITLGVSGVFNGGLINAANGNNGAKETAREEESKEETNKQEASSAETEEADFLEKYLSEIQVKKVYEVSAYRTETFGNISFSVPATSSRREGKNGTVYGLGDVFSELRVFEMEVDPDWAEDHTNAIRDKDATGTAKGQSGLSYLEVSRGKLFEERCRRLFENTSYIYVKNIIPEFNLNGLEAFRVRCEAGSELAWVFDCLAVWDGNKLICLQLGKTGLSKGDYDWMWQEILFSVRPAKEEQQKEGETALFTGEEGIWGRQTTRALQKIFGLPVDGLIKDQYRPFQDQNQGLLQETFEWVDDPEEGSELIRCLQKMTGAQADGFLGEETVRAMQRFFKTPEDGMISAPSQLIRAMQRWAEKQLAEKR